MAVSVFQRAFSFVSSVAHDPWKRQYYFWIPKYLITPRHTEQLCSLPDGTRIKVADFASFFSTYKTIFLDRSYDFRSDRKNPKIVICGENIGLSLLFFKRLYPEARIIAFEADPYIFSILKENVTRWNLSSVTLRNEAVWTTKTTLRFHSDHADGGRVTAGKDGNTIAVKAISLREFLEKNTDITFLNMDIEGAENDILRDCLPRLSKIPYIFIEYHSMVGRMQHIGEFVHFLEKKKYRIHLKPEFFSSSPFLTMLERDGMDMQINIFAKRNTD